MAGSWPLTGAYGTVRAATGDIDEMWIRDSAVQVAIYLPAARSDVGLRGILQGVIQRQAFYIMQVRRLGANSLQYAANEFISELRLGSGTMGQR